MSNSKKSFIILLADDDCYAKTFLYRIIKNILEANNISYFYIVVRGDETFNKSKLYYENLYSGSIVIVNKGKVYVYTDPNKDSFHSDTDVKNWYKKYINIK